MEKQISIKYLVVILHETFSVFWCELHNNLESCEWAYSEIICLLVCHEFSTMVGIKLVKHFEPGISRLSNSPPNLINQILLKQAYSVFILSVVAFPL